MARVCFLGWIFNGSLGKRSNFLREPVSVGSMEWKKPQQ